MAVALVAEEELDVTTVARGQRELGEFGWCEPREGGVFVAGWFAGDRCWNEHDQEGRVGVGDAELGFADGFDMDTEFLGEFAAGGGFVGLVRLDLAAGEFPQAAVAFVRCALTHKYALVAVDHGRDDTNRIRHADHCRYSRMSQTSTSGSSTLASSVH
jgi:hypothetical protein